MNNTAYNHELVDVAMLIASTVLKSGGETYRADECVNKILSSNGAKDVQIFSTPTGINVSAYFENEVITRIASVSARGVDLSCLDECIAVSRLLTEQKISLEEAKARVLKERNKQPKILYASVMAAICGAFFAVLVGGSWREFLCSLVTGFFGMSFYYWLGKRNISFFITNLLATLILALSARLFCFFVPMCDVHTSVIGSIFPLVPGLTTLNAIRDSFNGDIVSTGARAIEAVITAVSIACGVTIALLV